MKIIKFDLPIDGMKVRNLEELRDHFTPEILELYRTGLLTKWLASRQLSQELSAIKAIEVQEDQALLKRLCEIFDIQADEDFILAACATAAIIPVPAPAKTADETVPPAKVKPAAYLIQMPSQETINEVVEEAAYCLAEKLDFATGFEVDVDISTPKPDAPVSKTTEIKAKTLK